MSTLTNIKSIMKAENFTTNNGGSVVSAFLKKHVEFKEFINNFILKFPIFEKPSDVLSWLSRDIKIAKCLNCGKRLTFKNSCKGHISCSKSCSKSKTCKEHKNQSRLATMEKLGKINPFNTNECKAKIKKTNLERYGVENPMQNKEIALRTSTSLKNFNKIKREINRELKETPFLDIPCNLSTFNKIKRTLINEKINPKGSSYFITDFFNRHEDFCNYVESFLSRNQFFMNKSQVVEWLLTDIKIQKCIVCGNRLNYKLSKKGKSYFCSTTCRRSEKGHEIWQANLKKSLNEKYGVDNVSQLNSTREKVKQSVKKRFGVENVAQAESIKKQIRETNIKRYGYANVAQREDIKKKIRKTLQERYGVAYPSKNPEIAAKISKTALSNSYSNLKRVLDKNNLKFTKEIDFRGWISLEADLACLKCGCEFHYKFNKGKDISRACPHCHPFTQSRAEEEITNFIRKVLPDATVLNNYRGLISPQEVDIYIPSHNLAIEFNGLYWHSEDQGKDKRYHLDKTIACEEKDAQLIHIFEDEWRDKQQIVKNRLRHLLSATSHKIYARTCDIRNVDSQLASKFLNKYHLQGATNGSINLGLYKNGRLVALMTFCKSRFNKKYNWELLRYCTIGSFSIIGGASKLFKHFVSNYSGSIISYADRRWSNGNLYKQLGFSQLTSSAPAYYYVRDDVRYNRIKFQKHKLATVLETFDPELSEFQNMIINGYERVWDCGNLVYEYVQDAN